MKETQTAASLFTRLASWARPLSVSPRLGLDDVLYRFDAGGLFGREAFTLRQACEGVAIFGSSGSGKTSGSGAHLAEAYLRAGFGGLITTVKPEEPDWWRRLAKACGREDELVFVRPNQPKIPGSHPFNFLQYQFDAGGPAASTANLTSLLTTAMRAMTGSHTHEPAYWHDALRQLLYHAIELLILSGHRLSIIDLVRLVQETPTKPIVVHDADPHASNWMRTSFCARQMLTAGQRCLSEPAAMKRLKASAQYFLRELPGLPHETRASILSTFTTKAELLVAPPLGELLGEGVSELAMPDATHAGKLVVLDMPVLVWRDAGRLAQLLIKTAWQSATLQRDAQAPGQRPVFLWADEAQHLVTEEDFRFLQTARSAQACSVFITQSLTNYRAMMPGNNPRDATDALLAQFGTKIFHTNGDAETNDWGQRLFGQHPRHHLIARQGDCSDGQLRLDEQVVLEPLVPCHTFTTLPKGGARRRGAQAIVFQTGRRWKSTEGALLRAWFRQRELQ